MEYLLKSLCVYMCVWRHENVLDCAYVYMCTCIVHVGAYALVLYICVYMHLYCAYAYRCTCAYVYDKMMSIRMFCHFVYLENGSCSETKRRCYKFMKKYSSAGLLSLTTRDHWVRLFTVCASHSIWHFAHDYLFFFSNFVCHYYLSIQLQSRFGIYNFWISSKQKFLLKGSLFQVVDETEENGIKQLMMILKGKRVDRFDE